MRRPPLLPLSFILGAPLAVGACAAGPLTTADGDEPADAAAQVAQAAAQATTLLTGRFDSSAQAASDSRYFPVQLRTCALDVPALGAHVLYVEQAMLSSVDQPYRQRVYAVAERNDGAVVSTVYELLQPERFVGFCDLGATDQQGIMPVVDDIALLPGCAVILTATDDGFAGSTDGKACENDFQGATYATSEVTLTDAGIESWDRGYDAADVQVWGATAGAYRFDRKD
jgi:CpeT protein